MFQFASDRIAPERGERRKKVPKDEKLKQKIEAEKNDGRIRATGKFMIYMKRRVADDNRARCDR